MAHDRPDAVDGAAMPNQPRLTLLDRGEAVGAKVGIDVVAAREVERPERVIWSIKGSGSSPQPRVGPASPTAAVLDPLT
jgi:hypothetical protein